MIVCQKIGNKIEWDFKFLFKGKKEICSYYWPNDIKSLSVWNTNVEKWPNKKFAWNNLKKCRHNLLFDKAFSCIYYAITLFYAGNSPTLHKTHLLCLLMFTFTEPATKRQSRLPTRSLMNSVAAQLKIET